MYCMHLCPRASGLYVLGDSSKQKWKYNNLKASILLHEYVWRENFKEKLHHIIKHGLVWEESEKKRERVVEIWNEENFNYKSSPHRRSSWEDIWTKLEEVKGMSPMWAQEGRTKSLPKELRKGNMSAAKRGKGKTGDDGVRGEHDSRVSMAESKGIIQEENQEWLLRVSFWGVREHVTWNQMGMHVIYKA